MKNKRKIFLKDKEGKTTEVSSKHGNSEIGWSKAFISIKFLFSQVSAHFLPCINTNMPLLFTLSTLQTKWKCQPSTMANFHSFIRLKHNLYDVINQCWHQTSLRCAAFGWVELISFPVADMGLSWICAEHRADNRGMLLLLLSRAHTNPRPFMLSLH